MTPTKPAFNHVLILGIENSPVAVDDQIKKLIELRLNPVVVMGPTSENTLRHSDYIYELQIVYNPNGQDFLASLKAGLFFTRRPCFYLSFFTGLNPLDEVENQLKTVALRFHPLTTLDSNAHLVGTPQIGWVTSEGYKLLKKLPSEADLWQLPELRLKSFESVG